MCVFPLSLIYTSLISRRWTVKLGSTLVAMHHDASILRLRSQSRDSVALREYMISVCCTKLSVLFRCAPAFVIRMLFVLAKSQYTLTFSICNSNSSYNSATS